jgi:hypothetical protein
LPGVTPKSSDLTLPFCKGTLVDETGDTLERTKVVLALPEFKGTPLASSKFNLIIGFCAKIVVDRTTSMQQVDNAIRKWVKFFIKISFDGIMATQLIGRNAVQLL